MGRIVISANVSLDGVVQDPDGTEGFERGGWFAPIGSGDREAWAKTELAEALSAEALLLGRRTYELFAARWPGRTGEWADRLNGLPKYVVSSTLRAPAWANTTVLAGAAVPSVAKLKHEVAGDIVVYGSGQLAHTLIEHDLIDELRMMIYPIVLGAGERLFGGTGERKPLRLLDSRTIGDGLALLTYERNSRSQRGA